jgi:hypothetical protein
MTQDQLTAEAQASTVASSNSTIFKAVIAGVPSTVRTKSNGVEFVYIKATLLDGAAKGMTVLATRTVKNIKGEDKVIPVEGEEIIVYHTKLPSLKVEGEFAHFFEISTNTNQVADNSTLSSLL